MMNREARCKTSRLWLSAAFSNPPRADRKCECRPNRWEAVKHDWKVWKANRQMKREHTGRKRCVRQENYLRGNIFQAGSGRHNERTKTHTACKVAKNTALCVHIGLRMCFLFWLRWAWSESRCYIPREFKKYIGQSRTVDNIQCLYVLVCLCA